MEEDARDDAAFSPLMLRSLRLPNRFIKSATHDGSTIDAMTASYRRLAQNGVSLMTVAYMSIDPKNKTFDNQHHISDDNLAEWTKLVSHVQQVGGKLSAQLHHPGLFCMSSEGVPMGPSLSFLPSKFAWPRVMTHLDLDATKAQYVAAAQLCARAGFSAVELHVGHGYLLSQFLTPLINRRSDGYGGRHIENRARYPAEVIAAIRETIPESMPLIVKMNADDGLPFGGLTMEDSLSAARIFVDAGADAIVPSFGYTSLNGFGMLRGNVPLHEMASAMPYAVSRWLVRWLGWLLVPAIKYESLFLRKAAARFVSGLDGTRAKVIYVGGCDSLDAVQEVLAMGCAAVQIGRPLLREPWFVRKLEVAHSKRRERARNGVQRSGFYEAESRSTCIRCNLCTLASIDPTKFQSGCPHLQPGEGRAFEGPIDVEDLHVLT